MLEMLTVELAQYYMMNAAMFSTCSLRPLQCDAR